MDQVLPSYDRVLNSWTGPFIMAAINTRVVRRSQCLYDDAGESYGPKFHYAECATHGGAVGAVAMSVAFMVFGVLAYFSVSRYFLRMVLPKPGSGPSKETRDQAWFRNRLTCETVDGKILLGNVAGGDPGYNETAKMISEAAMCLIQTSDLPARGGVLTPARSMGSVYLERLREAGLTFQVQSQETEDTSIFK